MLLNPRTFVNRDCTTELPALNWVTKQSASSMETKAASTATKSLKIALSDKKSTSCLVAKPALNISGFVTVAGRAGPDPLTGAGIVISLTAGAGIVVSLTTGGGFLSSKVSAADLITGVNPSGKSFALRGVTEPGFTMVLPTESSTKPFITELIIELFRLTGAF